VESAQVIARGDDHELLHQLSGEMIIMSFASKSGRLAVTAGALVFAVACGGTKTESGSGTPAKADASIASAAPDGAAIYARCQTCHQATGSGTPGVYPPLAGSEIANGPAETPIRILLKGLMGPVTVHGTHFDGVMPAYGVGIDMSDAEVASVLTYVRSQWGNAGGPVTPEQVAKEREATKGKTGAWTAAELNLKP
jgi:mono/diheme cytochrome c family protein